MYLHTFAENEKKAFWVLANAIIAADSVLTAEEEVLLTEYVREMGVEKTLLVESGLDVSSAVEVISASEKNIQMSVFAELYALALCDNEYSLEEESFMGELKTKFGISDNVAKDIENSIKAINSAYANLNAIING